MPQGKSAWRTPTPTLNPGPQGPGFFVFPKVRLLPATAPASLAVMSTPHLLWPQGAPGALGNRPVDIPALTPFYPVPAKRTGASMIVFPGGGYYFLYPPEGEGYARWLAGQGITAYVLNYRVGPDGYRHPAMLHDAARAVRLARHLARNTPGLDPARIGVIGSSAGGHLGATIMTKWDAGQPGAADPIERESSRPDAGILCYPVITLQEPHAHLGSRDNLLGLNAPPALAAELSADLHVTPQTPPAFLWHTVADATVPVENSLLFAAALRRAGVSFALSIYANGEHGLGLGTPEKPAPPWTADCLHWLREQKFVR